MTLHVKSCIIPIEIWSCEPVVVSMPWLACVWCSQSLILVSTNMRSQFMSVNKKYPLLNLFFYRSSWNFGFYFFRGESSKKQILNFIGDTVNNILPQNFNGNEYIAQRALWEFVAMLVRQNGVRHFFLNAQNLLIKRLCLELVR